MTLSWILWMAVIEFQKSKEKLFTILFASDRFAPNQMWGFLKSLFILLLCVKEYFCPWRSSVFPFLLCMGPWQMSPLDYIKGSFTLCLCVGFSQQEVSEWGQEASFLLARWLMSGCIPQSGFCPNSDLFPNSLNFFNLCPYRTVASSRILHFPVLILLNSANALFKGSLYLNSFKSLVWIYHLLPARMPINMPFIHLPGNQCFKERWKRQEGKGHGNFVFLGLLLGKWNVVLHILPQPQVMANIASGSTSPIIVDKRVGKLWCCP